MLKILLIAAGGGAGAAARFLLQGWGHRIAGYAEGGRFPLGTLLVNVVGCLLIGFLWHMLAGSRNSLAAAAGIQTGHAPQEELRALVIVGFLGGLTTFSTFAWECHALAQDGHRGIAIANIVVTNVACLAAVFAGVALASVLARLVVAPPA